MEKCRVYFKFPESENIYYMIMNIVGNNVEKCWRESGKNIPHTEFIKAEKVDEISKPSIENAYHIQ